MADSSVAADVVDRLIDLFTEEFSDDENVLVVDGPDPVGDDSPVAVFVGMADPRNRAADSGAGSYDQEWASATAQTRNESGTIYCAVAAWDGSGVMQAARRACFDTNARIQRLLWRDTRLGGIEGLVKTSFTDVAWDQRQTVKSGALCVHLFAVKFDSYLQRSTS